jgi:hypothetical protein
MVLSVTQKRLKERWKERLEVTERRGIKRKELPYGIKEEVKGKGKMHPKTGHEGPEGKYRYSSTISLTSALDRVGGQSHASANLPPGKTRDPLYRRLGGPQGRSGRMRKISPPPGFDPRTVQPVASRYTDWAIPAHIKEDGML